MNKEQILACAEQSRLYAKSVLPNSIDDPIRWTYEYHKKFAQLIVAECATVILNNDIEKQEDYGVNHLFFNGWERGVIDSCQIIKKHFAVE